MTVLELSIILILCIILLKPNDIEAIVKNIGIVIIRINKFIHNLKNELLKL